MPIVYFRIEAHGSPPASRVPSLERLIARADRRSVVTSWRAEAFRAIASNDAEKPPAVAVAQWRASGGIAPPGWVALATPVHLIAGMSNVHLPIDGILEIDPSEADTLAADFNRSFRGGGVRLERGLGSALLCVFDAPLAAETTPPAEALGGDVWAHQPRGGGSAGLRRLATEIEMWLFDHAVNAARRARGVPGISALWLWGGGPADTPLPRVTGWTAGDDALFLAFDPQSQYPAARAESAADGSGSSRSGVVVLPAWPGTPLWAESEQRWLTPALADLKAGRLSRIEISAAATRFSVSARGLRRFWRRSEPWWKSFGVAAAEEGTPLGD